MNLFETVKNNVSLREAAQAYGLEVNRHGKALCPFHNDRHPSLYVANDHYYCFTCGEHGDVIDFTARLFDLKPYQQCVRSRKAGAWIYRSGGDELASLLNMRTGLQNCRTCRTRCTAVLNSVFKKLFYRKISVLYVQCAAITAFSCGINSDLTKQTQNPKTNRCTAAYSTGVYRTEPYTNNLFSRPHSGRKDKL